MRIRAAASRMRMKEIAIKSHPIKSKLLVDETQVRNLRQTPPSRPRRQRSDTTPTPPPALLLFGVITASRRTQRLTGANECEGIENDESAFVRPRSRGWEGEGRVQGRGIAGAGRAGGKCGGRRRLQLRSLRRQYG